MKKDRRPLISRTRVRLEFTAIPRDRNTVGFVADKKVTALRVMLTERFGSAGNEAFEQWLLMCADMQHDQELARIWKGGGDAA